MSLIEWTPELSVHIPSIDAQHKELVRLINELHDAMRSGRGKDEVGRILRSLASYTQTHFEYEEAAMQRAGYPSAVTHKSMHQQLTTQVRTLSANLSGGKSVLSMDVLEFLRTWLRDHILKADKAYSGHLLEKGIR